MPSDRELLIDGLHGKRNKKPIIAGQGNTVSKADKTKMRQAKRLAENKEYLKNTNVKAFLGAISVAEGGGYNRKYGGKKFTDFSTHPGAGTGGKMTAAGMYQIIIKSWRYYGQKMGLTDFSPTTQDLMAIEILREVRAVDKIVEGDIDSALSKASFPWAALPQGPGKPNRHPPQPYMKYDDFVNSYKSKGGTVK